MKKHLLSIFLLLTFLFYNHQLIAQYPNIEHHLFQWEHVLGVPCEVNDYEQWQGAIYAATECGLYKTFDEGENWERVNGIPEVPTKQIVFHNSTMLVKTINYSETISGIINVHTINRTADNAETFEEVFYFTQTAACLCPHGAGTGLSGPIHVREDGGFFMQGVVSQFSIANNTIYYNYFSEDDGLTWNDTNVTFQGTTGSISYPPNPAVITSTNDTTIIFRKNEMLVFGDVAFSDTIKINSSNLFEHDRTLFANGKLYIAKTNATLYSTDDFGDNWKIENLPFDYIRTFTFEDGHFYVLTGEGKVFKSENNFPEFFSEIIGFENVSSFGIFGNTWFANHDNLNYRSQDGGNTWVLKNSNLGNGGGSDYILNNEWWRYANNNFFRYNESEKKWDLMPLPFFEDKSFYALFEHNGFWFTYLYGNGHPIWRSADQGQNWVQVHNLDEQNKTPFYFSDGNRLFLENYYTDDNGDTWQALNLPEPLRKISGDTLITLKSNEVYISKNLGNTWDTTSINNIYSINDIAFYNGKIVAAGHKGDMYLLNDFLNEWVQTGFPFAPILDPCVNVHLFHQIEDRILLGHTGHLVITGTEGVQWLEFLSEPSHYNYQIFGVSVCKEGHGEPFVQGGYLNMQNGSGTWRTPLQPIDDHLSQHEYGFVEGNIFKDKNNDCTFNGNDTGIAEKIITDESGNYFGITNDNGYYKIAAPVDTHYISTDPILYHTNNCTGLNVDDIELSANETKGPFDFTFEPIPNKYDLVVSLLPTGNARPGFSVSYKINIENVGTEIASNVNLNFSFNEDVLDFTAADISPDAINDGELIFNLNELLVDEKIDFKIQLKVLADVDLIGEEINFSATVNHAQTDGTPFNNTAELTQIITGSFDPNDKQVFPTSGFPTNSHTLDYLIRFQNTGTDTAFRVVVRDTISPFLDITSFRMVEASHTYDIEVGEGGAIKWFFENIMLPDSNINEPASHGFIHFQMDAKDNLPVGTLIENEAAIFFDFNPPIITNTAIQEIIYPNDSTFLFYDICTGDSFGGLIILSDTIFYQTLQGSLGDSVIIYNIHTLPLSIIELEASLCKGESIIVNGNIYDEANPTGTEIYPNANIYGCDSIVHINLSFLENYETTDTLALPVGETYNGVPVFSDTVFIENLIAENGCDSIVTTHISVFTSTNNVLEKELVLNVSPNPFGNYFNFYFNLNKKTELNISITDPYGKAIKSIVKNQSFNPEKNTLKINMDDWPSGIYLIHFKTEEGSFSKKIIKI